jgi:hypothetical protein
MFLIHSFIPPSVHQGKHNGHIAHRELSTLLNELVYACQNKAWFDEPIVLKLINEILAPYVATAPERMLPILFLNSFKVHMKSSVVNAI